MSTKVFSMYRKICGVCGTSNIENYDFLKKDLIFKNTGKKNKSKKISIIDLKEDMSSYKKNTLF